MSPLARSVVRARDARGEAAGSVTLDYAARALRRRRIDLDGAAGTVLVDLPAVTGLDHGDRLVCEDGAEIEVRAATEPLWEVRGADLARLAWHIGNRHAPCEIGAGWLRLGRDPVLEGMLRGLGAEVTAVEAPFRPEGGAYGEGRVHGHGHSHDHDHAHD